MILENINGIVVIDKEKGYTSHDVVNVIRRIYGTRKVGHTGTLDPDATGVLPICIGKATKVCDMLTFSDKEYVARVCLGVQTDTQDMTGEVLKRSDVSVTYDKLCEACEKFKGETDQLPPMYSAIKIGGKKLCDLARKGVEVERKTRKITIHNLEISDFDGTEFTMRVSCSKGTYIRTLCHDIGISLGCGGAMKELRRTKASIFDLGSSHTLEELKDMNEDQLRNVLMPVDSVFSDYPMLKISDEVKKRVCNGATGFLKADKGTYRVYDKDGVFLCIATVFDSEEKSKNPIKLTKAFF